jgi:hypothetical protein
MMTMTTITMMMITTREKIAAAIPTVFRGLLFLLILLLRSRGLAALAGIAGSGDPL